MARARPGEGMRDFMQDHLFAALGIPSHGQRPRRMDLPRIEDAHPRPTTTVVPAEAPPGPGKVPVDQLDRSRLNLLQISHQPRPPPHARAIPLTMLGAMRVLILGGQNPRHRQWVRDVAEALQTAGYDCVTHDYRNWDGYTTRTDVETEVQAIGTLTAGWTDYAIVAKSIGTVIASLATARGLTAPAGLVFLGVPLASLDGFGAFEHAVEVLPPVQILQNESDPFGSARDVQAFFTEHAPQQWHLEVVPGRADHDYVDVETITRLVTEVAVPGGE